MSTMKELDKKYTSVICTCGDDSCGSVSFSHDQRSQFSWKRIFEFLASSSRFKLLLVSSGIALLGYIINYRLQPDWIIYIWWVSILVGLIIPIKLAFKSLQKGKLTINTLLAIASISALLLKLYQEAVLLVIIFSLGEILEAVLVKTMEGGLEGLKALVPSSAILVDEEENHLNIPIKSISKGQTILVRTGDIVPIDSIVLDNTLEIQNAHLTGESWITTTNPGEIVYAGSLIIRGSSKTQSIVDGNNSQIHNIVKSVEDALQRKSSAERFSETFGKYYTPSVFALAIIIAFIIPLVSTQPREVWVLRSLVILVVSCACGLAVSVPVTMISAVASAAKNGVLIRGGAGIENIGKINALIFDKTGTLTMGKPQVKAIKIFQEYKENNILPLVMTLSSRSSHPISKSIMKYLGGQSINVLDNVLDFEEIAGFGIRANILSEHIQIIRDDELKYSNLILKEYGTTQSYSIIQVDEEVVGIIVFEDVIRLNGKETIQKLKKQGIHISMLTGDNFQVAQHVASSIGIDDFRAQVMPDEKVSALLELKEKYGYVAMVGDGINDAPALAESDVSFAMGNSGSEIAGDVADIVLMEDDLSKIPQIISHGRYATKIVKMNIFLSLITVLVLLSLAGMGMLNLISGIIINEGTALLIIANGLRLMRFKS